MSILASVDKEDTGQTGVQDRHLRRDGCLSLMMGELPQMMEFYSLCFLTEACSMVTSAQFPFVHIFTFFPVLSSQEPQNQGQVAFLLFEYQRCCLSTHLNPLLASLGKILSSLLLQLGRLGPRVEKQSQVLEPASGRGSVSDHFVITLAVTDAPESSSSLVLLGPGE